MSPAAKGRKAPAAQPAPADTKEAAHSPQPTHYGHAMIRVLGVDDLMAPLEEERPDLIDIVRGDRDFDRVTRFVRGIEELPAAGLTPDHLLELPVVTKVPAGYYVHLNRRAVIAAYLLDIERLPVLYVADTADIPRVLSLMADHRLRKRHLEDGDDYGFVSFNDDEVSVHTL